MRTPGHEESFVAAAIRTFARLLHFVNRRSINDDAYDIIN
jgi:hypothetical protein